MDKENSKQAKKSRVCLNIGKYKDGTYQISINQMFLALLLFDEVILRGGFRDIFEIIKIFGPARANELIAAGCLKFEWDICATGTSSDQRNKNNLIYLRSVIINSAEPAKILESRLNELEMLKHKICIPKKIYRPLQKNISDNLILPKTDLYVEAAANASAIFTGRAEYVKASFIKNVQSKYNAVVKTEDLKLEVWKEDNLFRIESNINSISTLNADQFYDVARSCYTQIESPLTRLEHSQVFDTMFAVNKNENANFQVGLQNLLGITNATSNLENIERVLKIGEVPNFESFLPDIKIDKLLEIRGSKEIIEFRSWINQTKEMSDEEIEQLLTSVWQRIISYYRSTTGKVLSVTLSAQCGPLLGLGVAIFDTFLADKLLKPGAPIAFIDTELNSIFPFHAKNG